MTIVVLSDAGSLEQAVRAAVGDSVDVETMPLKTGVRAKAPDMAVVIVDGATDLDKALEIAKDFDDRRPEVTVVLGAAFDSEIVSRAMQVGVRDVLAPGSDGDRIREAVKRAIEVAERRRDAMRGTEVTQQNRLIMVMSPKGGAGKTTISTNLAVGLAKRAPKEVALIDADLQFGDVAVMLKLTPHHTIVDAVSVLDRMDAPLLDSLLVTHEPSGLRVMPAPLEPAFADQVGAAEMVAIVEMLRSFCSYVIVDTPAYFNDVVLGLVEVSDKVMLVAGMDIPNIKNVKIGLQTLRLLNTPMDKLLLILNRANSKVKLDIGEVERTLQLTADALIPSDVVVPQSVNKGEPVVLHSPKSGVTKAINQLAEQFLPQPASKKRR